MTRSPEEAPLAFDSGRPSPPPIYAEHFQLQRAPFDSTPESRFLYPGRSYTSVQSQVVESLRRREGLVVLTGATGTGKTTLCRAIVRALASPTIVSEIVNPFLTSEDLLKQVLVDFGAAPSDSAGFDRLAGMSGHDLLLAVKRFLETLPVSARAIVVIDDAHQLQPRVLGQLRALANIQTSAGRSPQILLVGQPELDLLLRHADVRQLNERVVRRCGLEPLAPDEILPYIAHRLAAATVSRLPEPDSLTLGAAEPRADEVSINVTIKRGGLTYLASLSRGVPRALNLLGDRALDVAYEQRTHDISRHVVSLAARRLGMRVPVAVRFRTATAGLLIAALAVAVVSAGVWAASRLAWPPTLPFITTRTTTPAPERSPAPAIAPAAEPPAPAARLPTELRAVDPLETADSYVVVVGSFKGRKSADEAAAGLTAMSLPAFVRADGEWHLLLIGPYVTAVEANEAAARVSGRKFPDAHVQRQTVPQPSDSVPK